MSELGHTRRNSISIPLSGVSVTPMTSGDLYAWITQALIKGRKGVVLAHNLHSMYVWEVDSDFRDFYDGADVVLIDGFPVLKLVTWFSGRRLTTKYRLGTLDWLSDLFRKTPVRRLAVVGATCAGNARTVDMLQANNEASVICGWSGDGWSPELASRIVAHLHEFKPDMVLVGLGMPLQEKFLSQHWHELPPAIYAAVGGAIDSWAGVQRRPPRWLGNWGLEWLFRMLTQPRRLSKRYLVEPWVLVFLLVRKWAKGRI